MTEETLRQAKCPDCEHVFYIMTSNKYSKKFRCPNCGEKTRLKLR